MDSVLIVSSREQAVTSFEMLLRAEMCNNFDTAKSGAEARRLCDEKEYGLVIINSPLSDEFGDGLAIDLLKCKTAGVMLVVKSELEAMAESKTSEYGAFVISKPLSRQLFSKAVRLVEATQRRMSGIRKENVKLQKKIEDIRIINRAKYILMEYLSMTEPQAHRYLEKQAMDLRLTKLEVAKNLLSTYDN